MPKPVKIVHVVHALGIGGLENGLVNILNNLGDPFAHAIICLSRSGPMAERIQNPRVQIIEMQLPTDKFRFPVLRLAREIQKSAPDIVHTRGWSTVDAICAARVAGVSRVIHSEHGREAGDPDGRNRKRNIVRKFLSPLISRFVTVSDDLKTWLVRTVGVPECKVTTIHNGVDTERFASVERAGSRRALGLDDSVFTIGTVGRLDPVKDHASLLHAFRPIARSERPSRLLIAGAGPMQSVIQSLAAELNISDKIQLLGERCDVPQILKACDVFTLTSIAEGISNTILEAMASGLPIVATRVGGNPELVDDGVNGYLVDAGDVSALTASYETYLYNPNLRDLHGRNARRRTEQRFTLERMASQYAQLYQELVGTREDRAA
jgi:sugar transferase (PEP-CTERM/EpsH1 system associated)